MVAGEEDKNSNSHGKPVPHRNSSMSDAESTVSHPDSWHSPLPSPHDPGDLPFKHENNDDSYDKFSKALVLVDQNHPSSPTKSGSPPPPPPESDPPVVIEVSKLVKDRPKNQPEILAKIPKRSRRKTMVERAALPLRAFGAIACLVSFSVLAADKTQGWSGDSFDRYIEYRYCLVVNIIGFVYSAFQALDGTYSLVAGKPLLSHRLRHHSDFAADQILAYLLISASSSAATREEDWISNWGEDEFTMMARASIAVSSLAFAAFSMTALISGYRLCNNSS